MKLFRPADLFHLLASFFERQIDYSSQPPRDEFAWPLPSFLFGPIGKLLDPLDRAP